MGRHAKILKELYEPRPEEFPEGGDKSQRLEALSRHLGMFIENKEEEITPLPSRVMLRKNFVFQLGIKGHPSAAVTLYFREGQIVNDPEKIKHLIENNALLEILN